MFARPESARIPAFCMRRLVRMGKKFKPPEREFKIEKIVTTHAAAFNFARVNANATEILIPVLIGGVLSLVFLWLALRANRRKRLVDNLPTCKTTGIFIGLVEAKGTAESSEPVISFLAGRRCVYYTYSVDEHWSRTVTETYTDSQGKTQTRTRHESGWKTGAARRYTLCRR